MIRIYLIGNENSYEMPLSKDEKFEDIKNKILKDGFVYKSKDGIIEWFPLHRIDYIVFIPENYDEKILENNMAIPIANSDAQEMARYVVNTAIKMASGVLAGESIIDYDFTTRGYESYLDILNLVGMKNSDLAYQMVKKGGMFVEFEFTTMIILNSGDMYYVPYTVDRSDDRWHTWKITKIKLPNNIEKFSEEFESIIYDIMNKSYYND